MAAHARAALARLSELASDTGLENVAGQLADSALGFEEVDRAI